MDININVLGQKLRLPTNLRNYIDGSEKFIRFNFDFSDDSWTDMTITAQFQQSDAAYNVYLDTNRSAYLPAEIKPGKCDLVLFGNKDGVKATTSKLALIIGSNGIDANADYVNNVSPINTFRAFYAYMPGDGGEYLTFEQVPFRCDLVSVIQRWGIGNLSPEQVYSVFYDGKTKGSRFRKKIASSTSTPNNVPNNVDDSVVVTNEADSNGTYTVKIYCDGCTFNNIREYVCFLAQRESANG